MSRIERPEDWEWTEDEHLAIWYAECLATSRLRELCVAFRDPEAWGRAIRTLGYLTTRQTDVQGLSRRPYDWQEDGEA